MNHINNETLRLASIGDTWASETILDYMYACVAMVLGPNSSDIDDAAEDAYLKMHEALQENRYNFDESGRPSAWVATIAVRVAVDYRRRSSRESQRFVTCDDHVHERLRSSPEVEHQLEQVQMHQMVNTLVSGLERDDRSVIVLRYWEEMSQGEIASALAIPIGTVKSRLHRAEKRLRAAVIEVTQSDGFEPETNSQEVWER